MVFGIHCYFYSDCGLDDSDWCINPACHPRPGDPEIRLEDKRCGNCAFSFSGHSFLDISDRNLIVFASDDFPEAIPDNYVWMTAGQLKEFIKYNNFVNVQARCLLSSLSFI